MDKEAIKQRMDSLQKLLRNRATGMGTYLDKSTFSEIVPPRTLSKQELDDLYNNCDMCSVVIDVPANLMTATWVNFELGEAENDGALIIDGIKDYEVELETRYHFNKAAKWAFLYGSSYIFIGAEDGKPIDEPLDYNNIKSVEFLLTLDPYSVSPADSNVTIKLPEVYEVSFEPGSAKEDLEIDFSASSSYRVHSSRLLRFTGLDSPNQFINGAYQKGISKLQKFFWPYLEYSIAYQSVSSMLAEYDMYVHAYEGLGEIIASGGEDFLMAHMEDLQLLKSMWKIILIDKKFESGQFLNRDLSGVDKALERLEHRLALAADMPYLYFWNQVGRAGMGDSGDAERALMQQKIALNQERMFRKNLRTLYKIIFSAKNGPTKGRIPSRWSFDFNPIVILNPVQEAEIKHKDALTAEKLVNIRAITPGEARSLYTGSHYNSDITLHSKVKPIFEYASNTIQTNKNPEEIRDPESEYERKKENIELGKKENVDSSVRTVDFAGYKLLVVHEPGAYVDGTIITTARAYYNDKLFLIGDYLSLDVVFLAELRNEDEKRFVYGIGFFSEEFFRFALQSDFYDYDIFRIRVITVKEAFNG